MGLAPRGKGPEGLLSVGHVAGQESSARLHHGQMGHGVKGALPTPRGGTGHQAHNPTGHGWLADTASEVISHSQRNDTGGYQCSIATTTAPWSALRIMWMVCPAPDRIFSVVEVHRLRNIRLPHHQGSRPSQPTDDRGIDPIDTLAASRYSQRRYEACDGKTFLDAHRYASQRTGWMAIKGGCLAVCVAMASLHEGVEGRVERMVSGNVFGENGTGTGAAGVHCLANTHHRFHTPSNSSHFTRQTCSPITAGSHVHLPPGVSLPVLSAWQLAAQIMSSSRITPITTTRSPGFAAGLSREMNDQGSVPIELVLRTRLRQ
jgi:hypothetical protein